MTQAEAIAKLQIIFDRLFVEPPALRPGMTAKEVPDWDSLKHVELLMAIEKELGISFSLGEMVSTQNVDALAGAVAQHAGTR